MTNRGTIQLTHATYKAYEKNLRQFGGKTYYASFPVTDFNAKENTLTEVSGERKPLCF